MHTGRLHEPYTPIDIREAIEQEDDGKEDAQDGTEEQQMSRKSVPLEIPPEPPPQPPRVHGKKQWLEDRLPPDLTTPIPLPRHTLSSRPLELNPDLFWNLHQKANNKWSRGFDIKGTAGVFRSLSSTKNAPAKWLPSPTPTTLMGKTILFIPSPNTVLASLQRILNAKKANKNTAALCLIPQSLLEKPEV